MKIRWYEQATHVFSGCLLDLRTVSVHPHRPGFLGRMDQKPTQHCRKYQAKGHEDRNCAWNLAGQGSAMRRLGKCSHTYAEHLLGTCHAVAQAISEFLNECLVAAGSVLPPESPLPRVGQMPSQEQGKLEPIGNPDAASVRWALRLLRPVMNESRRPGIRVCERDPQNS